MGLVGGINEILDTITGYYDVANVALTMVLAAPLLIVMVCAIMLFPARLSLRFGLCIALLTLIANATYFLNHHATSAYLLSACISSCFAVSIVMYLSYRDVSGEADGIKK